MTGSPQFPAPRDPVAGIAPGDGPGPALDPVLAVRRLLGASCPVLEPGHVWLAGAGPGDRGHLTLHALCGLIQADVIVFDALVDPGVLELARPEAVLEFAGKRGGRPSVHQSDISARLVALARDGKRVLRLKGGDPYVFGRGAEEALILARETVPFRIVPGLTAGLAGLAAAGIPATMRGVNQAILLATGHSAEGEADPVSGLDWEAIARLDQPVVLYMAVRNLAAIATRLRGGGMDGAMPAAAISRAATPDQRILVGTLDTLPGLLEQDRLPTPALIVIGRIVSARDALLGLAAQAQAMIAD
ncbi:uroporphyrinogen-III C-methyltransferase [Acetobacteraceae bacterium KSS8]|uniref:uroporphyrinogen-III C-methyltransferase n=1 Tax=Endosaccharibacter trunci TaxID=2812733 RepID=A0ABT1W2W6_9PROT|nr:uroporphyrinogen-III C-methyltransferase [Acetobacteraceae bacterium KSS8]